MTTTAILGGAFDPPHAGHLAMARTVLDAGLADEVVLMPCSGHAFGKAMAEAQDRVAMCRLLEGPGVLVDTFEIDHKLDGRTLALAMALEIEGRYEPLTFVIGADNAACFRRWYRHDELLHMARFIVVPREGAKIGPAVRRMFREPHLVLEKGVVTVSSTQIREALARGVDPLELDPRVLGYIKEHGLYVP